MQRLLKDWLFRLIIIYALLHIVLLFVIPNTLEAQLAGVLINIRYLLFFTIIYGLIMLQPRLRSVFLKVGVVVTVLSLGFTFLQATILPRDVLSHIGYSKETITPYLTVDNNDDYVRANGTFRGPNPLGAFAGVILLLIAAYVYTQKKQTKGHRYLSSFLVVTSVVSLWVSYSRSAVLGLLLGTSILMIILYGKKLALKHWLVAVGIFLVVCLSIFALKDSHFIQNVVLHNNPVSGSEIDSNDDHLSSLESGTERLLQQPIGGGVGSSGSASLRSDEPLILENQYLFIAHESGWFGLGIFIAILSIILYRLYTARKDWLALGTLVSGGSLALIGLFLPVFADDTIGIIWFGLAAIALASNSVMKKGSDGKKTNQKTN